MRILVCGGRTYRDIEAMRRVLTANDNGSIPAPTLIHGNAPGADRLAAHVAYGELFWRVLPFPADWDLHGRAAGPIRNQEMIDRGKPDLVLAFPGGRGTADMVRRAEAAGVPVAEVR